MTFTQKWRNREGFDQNKMVMVNVIFPPKKNRKELARMLTYMTPTGGTELEHQKMTLPI